MRSANRLSGRQKEVLAKSQAGRRNSKIAKDLGISPSTVGTHLSRAKTKVERAKRASGIHRNTS